MKNTPSFLVTNEMWQEKFAELIIREAHDIIVCGGLDDVDDVLKHFGVEE